MPVTEKAPAPLGVVHGRFQVLHYDHLKYILAAKANCRHLVVGITNPDPSLTRPEDADPSRNAPRSNPLTYFERYTLVRHVLAEKGLSWRDFSVTPLPISHPDLYRHYVPLDAVFFLTIYDDWGRRKLERFQALGLKTRILWDKPISEKGITGTRVRTLMAGDGNWEDLVPPAAARLMKKWDIPGRLAETEHTAG
ncbi:MAG: nicotinate-nucleotide adenylyltransferase [Proteobacteria bacterium]|nr:nicotinate-nucleotide adenylyltransferase [Pseudomonadota bacterium]